MLANLKLIFSARRNWKIKVINGANVPFLLFLFDAKRLFMSVKYDNLITDFLYFSQSVILAHLVCQFTSIQRICFMLYSKIVDNIRAFGNSLVAVNDNNLGK
jgi:hypothetical protein